MSVQSELSKLEANVRDSWAVLSRSEKTVGIERNLENIPAAIEQIAGLDNWGGGNLLPRLDLDSNSP